MKKGLRLALVGSDSLRGKEIKNVLNNEAFPFELIEFFDPDVEGEYSKLTDFRGEPKVIQNLTQDSLDSTDLVLLAAEKKVNKNIANLAAKKKIQVIDLNETFARKTEVPVIVTGINDQRILKEKPPIVSNPHPASIVLAHLLSQTEATEEDGFTLVENQIQSELKRIFEDDRLPVSVTLVQAPVFHTYSIMTFIETKKNANIQDIETVFNESSSFQYCPPSISCPVSSVSVAGKKEIYIGQIKKEMSLPNSFWIWAVADNLTFGSALNAYEIAILINSYFMQKK